MAKSCSRLVALLLGLCCWNFSDSSAGWVWGNDPDQRSSEVGAIQEYRFQPVWTKAEFQAVLRADRAALFFLGKWSTDSILSKREVEKWARECILPFGV